MTELDAIAVSFEAERERLHAIAGRMLGSAAEADDAVQETWLRLSRADAGEIENLGGWLTTVVSRICLDQLRSRAARHEEPIEFSAGEEIASGPASDPEAEAVLADAIGSALLVLLDRLTPLERVAFVLHDSFAVPFEEIGPIIGRNPAATRQLASRARRKIQGASPDSVTRSDSDLVVIDAFLTAARNGDMVTLLQVLAPDVVLRADPIAASFGVDAVVDGAPAIAGFFNGRAAAAMLARIEGDYGAIWIMRGAPKVVFDFTIEAGRIRGIDLIADPDYLETLEYELIRDKRR